MQALIPSLDCSMHYDFTFIWDMPEDRCEIRDFLDKVSFCCCELNFSTVLYISEAWRAGKSHWIRKKMAVIDIAMATAFVAYFDCPIGHALSQQLSYCGKFHPCGFVLVSVLIHFLPNSISGLPWTKKLQGCADMMPNSKCIRLR